MMKKLFQFTLTLLVPKWWFLLMLAVFIAAWGWMHHWPGRLKYAMYSKTGYKVDGCILDTTPIYISLGGWRNRSKFKVPIAYLTHGFNWEGGKQDLISIEAQIENLEPYCYVRLDFSDPQKLDKKEILAASLKQLDLTIRPARNDVEEWKKKVLESNLKSHPNLIGYENKYQLYRRAKKIFARELGRNRRYSCSS